MKILFLSNWFPYPPTNGAKIRIYNLIRQLADNHEITLLCLARTVSLDEARTHLSHMEQFCRSVEVVAARPFASKGVAAGRGLVSFKPRSVVQTYTPEMAQLVDDRSGSQTYDVVVASEVGAPGLVSLLASRIVGVPKVLDALEVALAKDAYKNQSRLRRRIRPALTWLKLQWFTRDMIRQAAACTVPSEPEKENLLAIVPEHPCIKVLPHCLDLTLYNQFFGHPRPESLVFTGSFTYSANLDSARYFLEEIYPRIRPSLPEASVQIVGSTDGVDLGMWPIDDSISFVGFLQDVRPAVAQSWLSVVPLRVGAGTRLKIIESMALGTPVVSTSKGAEGLEVTHGENILIADDPQEFAQAVVEVSQNPRLRERLSQGGLRLVAARYGSEVMGRGFASLLDQVVVA
jgi:glycosyltransferase involved in cell wall biosynthesis